MKRQTSYESLQQHLSKQVQLGLRTNSDIFADVVFLNWLLGNRPIFTRALLEEAAAKVEIARHPKTRKDKICISHIHGGGTSTDDLSWSKYHASLQWSHSYNIASQLGKCAPYCLKPGFNAKSPFAHILKPNDPQHSLRQWIADMEKPDDFPQVEAFEAQLLASSFWAGVKQQLLKLEVKVENISCAAFGDLYCESLRDGVVARSLVGQRCMQHLLACAISRFLSQRYAEKDATATLTPIPIVAFDPEYTLAGMHTLSHFSPPVEVVSDPYHLFAITPTTLVMVCYVPMFTPFHEMVADICYPSGPAAIFCTEIPDFAWHKQGKAIQMEHWTPRTGRMLEKCDKTWLGADAANQCELATRLDPLGWTEKIYMYSRRA